MSLEAPKVTLGIATYNRDRYLEEAIRSALDQDYDSFEVLVVVDGPGTPEIDRILEKVAGDRRLRVVRHGENRGIAAAYNTFISEGRGELIAMIGDDDLCLPGRLRRQAMIFEQHPDTGVVLGNGIVIDEQGTRTGVWQSGDLAPSQMIRSLVYSHNHLVDPTRMVHRRVYEHVGGYDDRFPLANDFHFWLRAARDFRFRHCGPDPVAAIRRHGENTSDERARAQEITDVERALDEAITSIYPLRELVPELDWAVLEPAAAERQALERLADGMDRRLLPLPGLAANLRARASEIPVPARPSPRAGTRRLMMTSFGYNDAGGGTTVPRLVSKELVRRGWEVTVFYAATTPTPSGAPYELSDTEQDGVRLIGVHNRPSGLFDMTNPRRELDDPEIAAAFARTLDEVNPEVVHFHNLHNLGSSLIDQVASRGLPAYFTTHNYWLVCPRVYLMTGQGNICSGPGNGAACASCVGSYDPAVYGQRLSEIRDRAARGLNTILAVSDAVRETLLSVGYQPDLIDVVRQAMPTEMDIWEQVGRDRKPGRLREKLTVAFLGSAYPHKGPQLLIEAAQRTDAAIEVRILGEIPDKFVDPLRRLDKRGVAELWGSFSPSEIGRLLEDVDVVCLPSMWWDCAPLAAAECKAARCPLLVARLGGLPEAVIDNVDGLVFDGLSADDLASKLDRLASEEGLLERLQSAIAPPRPFSSYVDQLESYYDGARPPRDAEQRELQVFWKGDHGLKTSLSIVNDQISSRLEARVCRLDQSSRAADPPLVHPANVEVRHQWPPDFSVPRAGRLATIVPWEFGAIPSSWAEQITANVDELWVPSDFVRRMYIEGGIDPQRIQVIPNGVDLDIFSPDGDRFPLQEADLRFLFVGGLIYRKAPELLLAAYRQAFAGRDDVLLVFKDFGKDSVYRNADRETIVSYAAAGGLPRVQLIDDELDVRELAAVYRSCDMLVHPYRGEGFGMPILEAMACGLPVIATSGGPSDEFCPPDAGWRIGSKRVMFPSNMVDSIETVGRPWLLEPDREHLAALLRQAAAEPEELRRRGLAARAAAEQLSWDHVAGLYSDRVRALAAKKPLSASQPKHRFPLPEDVKVRVLATPAWRGEDRLGELLREWIAATTPETSACLYLLSDPRVDGTGEELEAAVMAAAAAAGVDLEGCADINVMMEPFRADLDRRLHEVTDAYVPLHPACEGQSRIAAEQGSEVTELGSGALARLLARRLA